MASTYTPIASITLSSNASTIEFTSIPATYTDLVLVASAQTTQTGSTIQELQVQINTDTGTNYSVTNLTGDGTSAASSRRTNYTGSILLTYGRAQDSITGFPLVVANFMNYANATTYKTVIARTGYAGAGTSADVGLWRSTSAINKLALVGGFTYKTGSTFTLYGIRSF